MRVIGGGYYSRWAEVPLGIEVMGVMPLDLRVEERRGERGVKLQVLRGRWEGLRGEKEGREHDEGGGGGREEDGVRLPVPRGRAVFSLSRRCSTSTELYQVSLPHYHQHTATSVHKHTHHNIITGIDTITPPAPPPPPTHPAPPPIALSCFTHRLPPTIIARGLLVDLPRLGTRIVLKVLAGCHSPVPAEMIGQGSECKFEKMIQKGCPISVS